MYLIFYLSALFRWENTYQASLRSWGRAGTSAFVVYLATALVGLAVRLYLISATAMDYHLLGNKYRILTPALFVLDMIWALRPFSSLTGSAWALLWAHAQHSSICRSRNALL